MTTHPPISNAEDHAYRTDHTVPRRRTLPTHLAEALADAHKRSGFSFRGAAGRLGLDWSYWRRLCRGERCPSREVAARIIQTLNLDDDTATELLASAVVREPAPPGRRGRVIRTGP